MEDTLQQMRDLVKDLQERHPEEAEAAVAAAAASRAQAAAAQAAEAGSSKIERMDRGVSPIPREGWRVYNAGVHPTVQGLLQWKVEPFTNRWRAPRTKRHHHPYHQE